jgi:hypothetical protein
MNDHQSAEEHRRRMERGVGAVREYLQAQFPGYVVETLERGSRNSDRRIRTFRVRKDSEEYLLRVVDEVLDLDAEGVSSLLLEFGVAGMIHRRSQQCACPPA